MKNFTDDSVTQVVRVFTPAQSTGIPGGNPAPITLGADALSSEQMQYIAAHYGHEAAFILHSSRPDCAYRFRFFVPQHEMEMCGHATIGALWYLHHRGSWDGRPVVLETLSGLVQGEIRQGVVRISQPRGQVEPVNGPDSQKIADVLGVDPASIMGPVLNAKTSRVKTLIRVSSEAVLDALRPDLGRVEALCDDIGSTGLYPFAVADAEKALYAARQFPKSSGYPEDAATGIAAAALAFGLRELLLVAAGKTTVTVKQGVAMGSPSEIQVSFRFSGEEVMGCWLSGGVELEEKR